MTDGTLLDCFVRQRDEDAFESVVHRHGPMVLRICRNILDDPNDAEDAFQATFLVLIRRARTIRNREALGRWLYGVAYRISIRAKMQARRRSTQERQGASMTATDDGFDPSRDELRPLLHDELSRLPQQLRDPIVLCYMEGLTQEEAARRLRIPLGTLKGRLNRGRERLHSRLTRRGVAVTLMLLMLRLTEPARAVPAELHDATANAGKLALARRAIPETIPHRVAELVAHEANVLSPRTLALIVLLGLLILSNARFRPIPQPQPQSAHAASTIIPHSLNQNDMALTAGDIPAPALCH